MRKESRSGAGQFRDGGEQFARVIVIGLVKDLLSRANFHELAGAHDRALSSAHPRSAPVDLPKAPWQSSGHLRDENGKAKLEIGDNFL